MPSNSREYQKEYMKKRREKLKEQKLREQYLQEKLLKQQKIEDKKAELELPKDCEKFRLMILGSIPLNLTEKHHHMSDCSECYQWFLNHRKTYGGCRFW